MRTIWLSLAWKEWHEHKWKLVSIVAILSGVASLVMPYDDHGSIYEMVGVTMFLCSFPVAVFVGLGEASNERSHRTLPFLQALPVPMWRVAVIKLISGLLTVVLPLLITVLLIYFLRQVLSIFGIVIENAPNTTGARPVPLESGNWYIDTVTMGSLVAVSLFIWSAATGVNRKDEISAGATALSIIAGWTAILVFVSTQLEYLGPSAAWLRVLLLSAPPTGVFADFELHQDREYLPLHLITIAVMHIALIVWYVSRFGKVAKLEVRSPDAAASVTARPNWLGPPRSSALSAIAWKQFRESGPIAAAGLAIVIGITIVSLIANQQELGPHLSDFFAGACVMMGVVTAIVIGIGAFLNDVRPGLTTFWRSRPINPNVWFWTKFLSGLAVLLIAIYGPILLIALLGAVNDFTRLRPHEALVYPAIHLSVFAAAVATTCLVRQAVYAAILSIAVVCLGVFFGIAICRLPGWIHSSAPLLSLKANVITPQQFIFGIAISFTISTILAWLAVRYDWGKKSRY